MKLTEIQTVRHGFRSFFPQKHKPLEEKCLRKSSFLIPYATRFCISPENIILYGQSIGTVPTVDLASRYECAAVILHSPLTSGMRVAFPETKETYCFDAFPK